jgi:iron complex transport system substrate-binding protein
MNKRIFNIVLLLLLCILPLSGEIIVDDVGRKVDIMLPVNRVISLSPGHTEMIYFLSKEEKLIAVSQNCDYPDDTKNKIKAGTFFNPDIEKIIKLKPDLVISGGGIQKKAIKKLEDLKIPVIVFYPDSINGIIKNMEVLCKILNADVKKVENFKNKIIKNKKDKKVKTYLELWDKPKMAVGGKSFINDIIFYAGGENIFNNSISEYPKINEEEILKRNPEVIILLYETKRKNFPLFDKTDAGKNKRIFILEKEKQDIFLRPSPRILNAIEYLKNIYKDINEK